MYLVQYSMPFLVWQGMLVIKIPILLIPRLQFVLHMFQFLHRHHRHQKHNYQ
jgi:hypothetical protein